MTKHKAPWYQLTVIRYCTLSRYFTALKTRLTKEMGTFLKCRVVLLKQSVITRLTLNCSEEKMRKEEGGRR
jgi:hypothetical protein